MTKLSYWDRRQLQNMYEYMESAEKTADQIANLYLKASRYISYASDDIFERYQSRHKLSQNDAMRLINTMYNKTDIKELLEKLRSEDTDQNKRELLAKLEAPAYQARLERLQQLQNQIDIVMADVYEQEKSFNTSHYVDLANEAYYHSIYDIQQQTGSVFSFGYVDSKMINAVLNSKWSGKNYSARIWGNTKALAQDLKEELLINLVTGRTNREVANIINNKFGAGASQARRLVRTESNYLATELNFKAYKEAGIEKYRYLATLDLKTCTTCCRGLDGRIFFVSERKTGVNCPPMHPWCRCTTVGVISEKYMKEGTRRPRDPETHKVIDVPADMTYQEWYNKYVAGNPKAMLEEKKIKNRASDRKQWKKYREILRDNIPDSLDKFQDMKYNEAEKWEETSTAYKDLVLKEKIKSANYIKTIKLGQQRKHIRGTNEYTEGRSYITITETQAQELVEKYAGTGRIIRSTSTGKWQRKEKIVVDYEIGQYINKFDGTNESTNSFMISYAKDGTHIIPARRE